MICRLLRNVPHPSECNDERQDTNGTRLGSRAEPRHRRLIVGWMMSDEGKYRVAHKNRQLTRMS